MLLAKIKEKLFNRRNTVEIETLEGDLDLNGNIKAKNVVNTVVVSNIKQISDEILSSLKAGDIVQKEDSSGKHSYIVSFKKDGTGICLTYTDASVVETQSYDYTDGHWVYNSEDKMPLVNVEDASSGEIVDALGLDEDGKLVKGQAGGGGTKLYKHVIATGTQIVFIIYSTSSEPLTSSTTSFNMVSRECTSQRYYPIAWTNRGQFGILYLDFQQQDYADLVQFIAFGSATDTVTPL